MNETEENKDLKLSILADLCQRVHKQIYSGVQKKVDDVI